MNHRSTTLGAVVLLMTACMRGQVSVCDLFKDLKASDGRRLIITGDLIISKNVAVLGAADCDNEFESPLEDSPLHVFQLWPTALNLKPSPIVPRAQLKRLKDAAGEADRLRRAGKFVGASASFGGRLQVVPAGDLPAQLIFDSVETINVGALQDPSEFPVTPICDLFRNLAAWKGKRIAVRAESVSTWEGSWIVGRCKGSFYSNEYRWPVMLDSAAPAYTSSRTAALTGEQRSSGLPKQQDLFRGRSGVVTTATYVGRLRMRDKYTTRCGDNGSYITNGFGHLNLAVAEVIVETVRDPELSRAVREDEDSDDQPPCRPPNFAALCADVGTLLRAASIGCIDRAAELISKDGIDSKDGKESPSLDAAIRRGDGAMVRLLIERGAPVNPVAVERWSPLGVAAFVSKIGMVKLLLTSGADVDGLSDGATVLSSESDSRVITMLVEAGANPNAQSDHGTSALMSASWAGDEKTVKLLLDHGAKVDLKDNNGRTALMQAAHGKYMDAIPLLLARGADSRARDRDGRTALELAKQSKNEVAVDLLSAAMR